MNSEKVKEIKKALECQSTLSLPKCEKCNYKFGIVCKTEKLLEDASTLINEWESENERLGKQCVDWNNLYHKKLDQNQQLKDRIAELEKENEILRGTKNRLTFVDRIEIADNSRVIALKQFVEKLKEKSFILGAYKGVLVKDIDETLKEFIEK